MMEGRSDYILAPFGSFANGFMLKDNSDLDIALIIKDPTIASNVLENHHNLHKSLSAIGASNFKYFAMDRQFVFQFKIEDDINQIVDVEIVFNNIVGVANTELIWTYASLDIRFHQIGIVFKYLINKAACFNKT